MTVVPNLLDQDRKAFPFLRGEFLSDISITIVMASDGATRRHAVALPPLYKRATRALMPYIRGTVLAVLGLYALHDVLDGARTEVIEAGRFQAARAPDPSFCRRRCDNKYLRVLFNPLEQFRFH